MLEQLASAALGQGRAHAESLMRDRCIVYRNRIGDVDEETGRTTASAERVYPPAGAPFAGGGRGKRKLNELQARTEESVGRDILVVRNEAHFPVGAFTPQAGDLITWVASEHDPDLPGRVDRINGPAAASYTTAMRLSVSEQPDVRLDAEKLAALVAAQTPGPEVSVP